MLKGQKVFFLTKKGQKVKTIKKTKERNDKIKSDRIHYLFI